MIISLFQDLNWPHPIFYLVDKGMAFMHDTLKPQEWYDLNRFVLKLQHVKQPVLSLYLPFHEIGEAMNILNKKSGEPRFAGVTASIAGILHKAGHHSGSLCIFGWSEKGRDIVERIGISKEVPPIYVLQRKPYVKPLKDILEVGYNVVVLVMDHKRANIELYTGSELIEEIRLKSYLKGRHSKGGWSQKRYQQNREIQIRHFFNKVNQQLKNLGQENIELIVLGGRGLAKRRFLEHMDEGLARKTRMLDGISFQTPKNEITEHMIALLDSVRKATELEILSGLAGPAKHGLVAVRNDEIENKVRQGAVERLFIASDYYATSPKENLLIKRIIGLAKRRGSMIEFITDPEARRRLHKFGNVVARLRYR